MGLTYPSNKICPRCGTGGYVWYLDNSEYVAKCTNCDHYFRREDFPMCVLDEQPKPITNADRIRGMTDEELADWLIMNGNGSDYQTWLDWLREEISE